MRLFPHASLVAGLILALLAAAAFNWSWVAQHTITSRLPRLTVRRPLRSLGLLFGHRRWLFAFVIGIAGWVFYVSAVRLAPLSLVQSVSAAGLGLLAVLAQRAAGEPLPRREWVGVGAAVLGLVFLSASLANGASTSRVGSWVAVAAWLGASWVVAALSSGPFAGLLAPGAGLGLASGVLYAAADVGTKEIVHGGKLLFFIPVVLACHALAFTLIMFAFQRGRALATAGLSSFCTNALPIVGGLVIFHEQAPPGILGVLRFAAFGCVVFGAAMIARREHAPAPEPKREPKPEPELPVPSAVAE